MSKGYVMLAQNSEYDYVEQACLCAMSLHATNDNPLISLITNDSVPEEYVSLFDKIIEIPWSDQANESDWKVENRWKIYHASPYDETIVLDTDMLVLQDISSWWKFLSNYDLYFTSKVFTYRNKQVVDTVYRKAFIANNLPNLYSGLHYFKKTETAHEFYRWLELVMNNWELFYSTHVKEHCPKRPSVDVSAAVVAKILNCETEITNGIVKYPSFVHMKPAIQDWLYGADRWQSRVGVYLNDDLELTIGNHVQQSIFHYTEKDFVTNDIINRYKKYLGMQHV